MAYGFFAMVSYLLPGKSAKTLKNSAFFRVHHGIINSYFPSQKNELFLR